MADLGKYTFLEIYHEKEGVSRGAHLVEKINRAVYTAVQKQSNAQAARNNMLYSIGLEVPDVINLDNKTTGHILERLIADKVVTQIFRLDYSSQNNTIEVMPCFLAHDHEDTDQLGLIYNETIMRSVAAVEMMLSAMPVFDKEMIRADLLFDIEQEETPDAKDLQATLVEPFSGVHASKFAVLPEPDMMQKTIFDIEQEMIKRGKLIPLLNYGLLYFREAELLDRIQAAIEILNENLLPEHANKPGLKSGLDAVEIEESSYKLDEKAPATSKFEIRKAEILKKALVDDPQKTFVGTRFPGSLTVETLLSFGSKVDKLLQKHQKNENLKGYEQIKQTLMEAGENIETTMLVFTEKQKLEIPGDSWQNLVDDLDLYYHTWELHEGTMHIFIRREQAAFIVLIQKLGYLVGDERWKILAMKTIIEENESEMPELFSDRELIPLYGMLLRGVYLKYIPFLYRLLMLFGLGFARDAGFRIAKERIELEQKVLKENNQKKTKELHKQEEQKKLLARQKLHTQGLANEIVEQLDWFYFERLLVPSVGDIRSTLQKMELKDFERAIDQGGFKQLPIPDKSSSNENVLVYAVDSSWRSRMNKLSRVVEEILGTPEIAAANPVQYNRSRVLKKYLAKKDSNDVPKDTEKDDPYKKFGEEVEKVKMKEQAGDKESNPEDLSDPG